APPAWPASRCARVPAPRSRCRCAGRNWAGSRRATPGTSATPWRGCRACAATPGTDSTACASPCPVDRPAACTAPPHAPRQAGRPGPRPSDGMARPIWTGNLSFGLLNVPVSLMSGTRSNDLSFRMLASRARNPFRFERVTAEAGEEVLWKEIVKAFEYDKGNYVVIEKSDIASAAPESHESVEIEAFVDADSIDVRFYEKPYVLVPGKKAEKGYVLLRETLRKAKKIGVARVVIRTREYLSAVMPLGDALVLMLIRYPQELVDPSEYKLPAGKAGDYRISAKELEMATQLVDSMAAKWNPGDYHDEFRERLAEIIRKRIKDKGATTQVLEEPEPEEGAATNVVDFVSLLQKSLKDNRRTPAKKTATKKAARKAAPRKAAKAKKAPAKKAAKSGTRTRKAG